MIELKNISKSYGDKKILKNIDLKIEKSEITFLIGTSGAGKTTLLNIIGGLDNPDAGTITFNGKEIHNNLDEYRSKNVGFVFQDYNLISGLSVKKNIELAVELSGIDNYEFNDNMLGVKDLNQSVETLSGGEKQRVAIIRSVCKNADIIIADEPTGNLDSENARNVLELIKEIANDKHIIIVSHDIDIAEKYGDRIIRLKDGEIVEDIKKKKKFESKKQKENKIINNNLQNKKKGSMKSVWILGQNSIRIRKSKIISISLMLALTISLLTMVISFNNLGDELSNNVNVNYLENDLINLYYDATPNTSYKEKIFTKDVIDDIVRTYNPKEYVKKYLEEDNSWVFSVNNKAASVCLKQINIDEFFEKRVLSNDIEGNFIKNKNEIILAEDVADELFQGECIGKTILLCDDMGNNIECTIVGVNHTTNSFDNIYSYVSSEYIKELLYRRILQSIEERLVVDLFYEEFQNVKTGGIYGKVKVYDDVITALDGCVPSNDNEIMISSELAKYVRDLLKVEDGNLFTKQLIIKLNGLFPVKICGIFQSEDEEIVLTKKLIESMKELEPTCIDMYVNIENNNVSKVKEDINYVQDYVADTQLDNLKENVMMQTVFFSLALIAVGVVLMFMSMALITSFSKMVLLERKKEVAIVKSLGAGDKDIMLILLFDFGVIATSALIMSLVIYAVLKLVMENILDTASIIQYDYPILLLIIINLIFDIIIMIYISLNLRSLVKKMPAKLLIDIK